MKSNESESNSWRHCLTTCEYLDKLLNLWHFLSYKMKYLIILGGFPGGSASQVSACNTGDPGLILGQEDPLGKGVATHSTILAWRILWTEEPGGLLSMGVAKSWT